MDDCRYLQRLGRLPLLGIQGPTQAWPLLRFRHLGVVVRACYRDARRGHYGLSHGVAAPHALRRRSGVLCLYVLALVGKN